MVKLTDFLSGGLYHSLCLSNVLIFIVNVSSKLIEFLNNLNNNEHTI